MSKNNENKMVPKFRFPEFINSNEWDEQPLGNISNRIAEKNSDGEIKNVFTNSAVDGIVDQRDFFDKDIADKSSLENYYVVKDGDYVYNPRISNIAPVGPISKNKTGKSGAMSPLYTVFRFYDKNNEFYEYYFRTRHWFNAIRKVSNTGARFDRMSITDSVFMNIPVLTPSPIEQQKIAACLLSLDEVVKAECQKLDILTDHKKGLLQNLLPQAGETVPKFRFKQFQNSGDWAETNLTQVADYENGKAHEQDIADDGEFIVVNSKFISQNGEVKKFTNTAFCPAKKGDILMVLSDVPNGKAIAKCFLVEEDNHYTVNQRICRITPRNANSKILYYLLNRNPYFLDFDDGVKQTNLRKDDVLSCPLLIPENPKEQDKIADTLSSIDDLINAQNQKLETLQLHKKGLLQGLFPNPNEVTE